MLSDCLLVAFTNLHSREPDLEMTWHYVTPGPGLQEAQAKAQKQMTAHLRQYSGTATWNPPLITWAWFLVYRSDNLSL